ncbi:hypothetical protein BKA67DRAFT_251620 [Truncatella angustata]|uniref:CCHC-type domain-containing protein n=1 Tax=Truncatella angustata TaxID=152316 RepID=A0A9P8ZZB7_9PEZI|nr:uncharacterized protein BKA67DRAFT_251620 [Truncatella angustata]KAH6655898.1 hypothetical protein BKA67DRAFT_251620 [Truncatella angustata]
MVTTRSGAVPVDPHDSAVAITEDATKQSPESATGQKRSRDYVEELRGLTPDRNSDGEDDHAAKRARTEEDKAQHDDLARDAQSDLDDGEIVEASTPDRHALPPNTMAKRPAEPQNVAPIPPKDEAVQKSTQDYLAPQTLPVPPEVAGSTEVMPPEDLPAATESDRSIGEHAQAKIPQSATETQQSAEKAKTKSDPNQGVGLGLRTSFAKAPKKQAKGDISKPALGVLEFPTANRDWKIDATKFDQILCDHELDRGDCFEPKFWKQWMQNNLARVLQALQEDNGPEFDSISKPAQRVKVVRNAMFALLQPVGGVLYGTKKNMNTVRLVAQPTFDDGLTGKMINKTLTGAKKSNSTAAHDHQDAADASAEPEGEKQDNAEDKIISSKQEASQESDVEPGEVSSDESPVLSPEEIEHRKLYFPGSENYHRFCIHCVSSKHNSSSCPQPICQSCGSRDHTRYGCHATERCGKCFQLGHTTATCQEKLALAKGEREPCAYCRLAHTEEQCAAIWKSFNHAEVKVKKVKAIPSFCYICGQDGHYGPECGLNSGRTEMDSDLSIWSSAIRDMYVDPSSADAAIAWAGLNAAPSQPGQDFHIRGQAKKQSHVFYVSSDDSDDGFIHEPVRRAPSRGNIQINTNASRPAPRRGGFSSLRADESRRRENQREFTPPPAPPLEDYYSYAPWQPPLPAGPPPALPPPRLPDTYTFQGQRDQPALPRAPPGSLPPRPVNQGPSRNFSGSSQNGAKRGGGRGRPRKRT